VKISNVMMATAVALMMTAAEAPTNTICDFSPSRFTPYQKEAPHE